MNLDTTQVSTDLQEGVYAVLAEVEGVVHRAVMHYGPRPVFGDSLSCEVHLIDSVIEHAPDAITVTPAGRMRDVQHFASPDDLKMQIALDIAQAKEMLSTNADARA
jgi:riboflavin kinase/FMN adenylyltransferase